MKDFSTSSPKLYSYQVEGIARLSEILSNSVDRAALLADPPGAGKTPQAILTAQQMNARRVLVVCPASLRENWRREFLKWSDKQNVQVLVGGSSPVSKEAEVIIASYSTAINSHITSQLTAQRFDMLIVDESHYCKNAQSQTSRIVLVMLWNVCRYRLLITGTPLPNGRASEAWTMFSRLHSEEFGKWNEFAERFCIAEKTPWGLKYNRSKNLDKLQQIARDVFMVRRPREVCLTELPPLVRQNIYVNVAQKELFDVENGLDIEAIVQAVDQGLPLDSDHITTARMKLGNLKAVKVLEHVMALLEEVQQIVVFCHHRTVYSTIMQGLISEDVSVVGINGLMSPEERQKSVDDFQAKKARVFLASLKAANTGITLTAASTLVMAEYDWVPSVNEQAEGRIYRVTQNEISRVQYLVVHDSLDERILNVVQRKQREISKAVGV